MYSVKSDNGWTLTLTLHFHTASSIITGDIQMVKIELIPDLSHCVETVARREYQSLVKNYLQTGKGDDEFEEKVELLRNFLESADFRKLRSDSEQYLLEGQDIKFILYREAGETKCELVRC